MTTIRDESYSAYTQDHITKGGFGVFREALRGGLICAGSILVVEALDRLSRATVREAMAQLLEIINAGVMVVTEFDKAEYDQRSVDENPWALGSAIMYMVKARTESVDKAKRVSGAMRLRAIEKANPASTKEIKRFGRAPSWLDYDEKANAYSLRAEPVIVLRTMIDLYLKGEGPRRIFDRLIERGVSLPDGLKNTGRFYEVLRSRALIGEHTIRVMGETILIRDHYPALLTVEEFDALQFAMNGRGRQTLGRKGTIAPILTGMRLCLCGHCGWAMAAQNMIDKRRDDGTLPDAARRIYCAGMTKTNGCRKNASTSVVPIERALMEFCSDQYNLESLRKSDSGATAMAARIAQSETRAREIDDEVSNLLEVIGKGKSKNADKKLAKLEQEQEQIEAGLMGMKREHAELVNVKAATSAKSWKALVDGVAALDSDARMSARTLIVDTFSSIRVFIGGEMKDAPDAIDLELISRHGVMRYLRINRRTGAWMQASDIDMLKLPMEEQQ
jgi:hypothetical protein